MNDFDPARYWNDRHQRTEGLDGVGYLGLGPFNDWMYRVRTRVFRRLLRPLMSKVQGARVLDVGSGTGFYLDLWTALGAGEVRGIDISEIAIQRLEGRYPGKVQVLDLTQATDAQLSALGTFDFISVMDVLYHVVDDAAYAQAFANLARLLRPGGFLVFSENFLQHTSRQANAWQVSRERPVIEGLLRANGFLLRERRPWFIVMNNPLDSHNPALKAYWWGLQQAVRRSKILSQALGASLFPLEVALTKFLPESPTSEVALAERG
ncbi:MAG: class I SAM-dependent methyltransferase [Myxococcota bacterium]